MKLLILLNKFVDVDKYLSILSIVIIKYIYYFVVYHLLSSALIRQPADREHSSEKAFAAARITDLKGLHVFKIAKFDFARAASSSVLRALFCTRRELECIVINRIIDASSFFCKMHSLVSPLLRTMSAARAEHDFSDTKGE